MSLRIVQAQGRPFDVAGRAVNLDLIEICAAVPNLSVDIDAIKLDPSSGSGQGMQAALPMNFPTANKGVEVVLAIALGWLRCFRSVGILLRKPVGWLPEDCKAAYQETNWNMFECVHQCLRVVVPAWVVS
jgi:hypothetical protein